MTGQNRRMPCGMTLVWPGLWVGSANNVTIDFLETNDVGVLVWATPEISPPPTLPVSVRYIPVLLKDEKSTDLSPYFPVMVTSFKKCQGRGMVVVCRAGISRSATLALAALIGNTDLPQMNLKYAYETVKEARPFIRPNSAFFSQLIHYETKIRGKPTVTMVRNPYDSSEVIPDVYAQEISFVPIVQEIANTSASPFSMFVPL